MQRALLRLQTYGHHLGWHPEHSVASGPLPAKREYVGRGDEGGGYGVYVGRREGGRGRSVCGKERGR